MNFSAPFCNHLQIVGFRNKLSFLGRNCPFYEKIALFRNKLFFLETNCQIYEQIDFLGTNNNNSVSEEIITFVKEFHKKIIYMSNRKYGSHLNSFFLFHGLLYHSNIKENTDFKHPIGESVLTI